MADSESPEERQKRQEPPPLEFMRPGEQPPSAPSGQPPAAWVPRPEDFQRPTYYQPPAPRPGGRVRSMAAGILLILAGIAGFAWTLSLFLLPLTLSDFYNLTNMTTEQVAYGAILEIVLIYAQVLAVLGGILSFQRKNWKLAVACAVLGILNFGFYFIGSLLAMTGLFFLVGARSEFSS